MKLVNEFHGTEVGIRKNRTELFSIEYTAEDPDSSDEGRIAKAYIRRIRNKLCGIEGCTCGGAFGERPNYNIQFDRRLKS